jgi:hypothetical protein
MNFQFSIFNFQLSKIGRQNSGQIVLMIVLLTMVGLTVGLSLVSRTVTDIRISSQIEQSNRAFSAAEAGVETALQGVSLGGPATGNITLPGAVDSEKDRVYAQYQVSNVGGVQNGILELPLTFPYNSRTVWLVPHNTDGSLNISASYPVSKTLEICWGSDSSNNPAIELTLVYLEGSDYKIAKAAYDAENRGNQFYSPDSSPNPTYCGGKYRYRQSIKATDPTPGGLAIDGTATLLFLRITPVYSSTSIAIKPEENEALPIQGQLINSVGRTETGVVRKLQVIQGYKILPILFDHALFEEGN